MEEVDVREKAFHGAVREYVICAIIFLGLYLVSYAIIRSLKKRNVFDDLYAGDFEDYAVYRISLWICTLSMAVSVAAVLLIPFSIISNEILLRYPNNYYILWLNDSLVHSLWTYVFLLSNLCLFILLPFAYFFIESQGFLGFKNGIMTRVYESMALCSLVILLGFCLARLFYTLWNEEKTRTESLFHIWYYQLPFIYSCVSLFGVALLLTCTPLGFATLFTVVGELVAKPKLRRQIENERLILTFEEESLKRKLKHFNGRVRKTSDSETTCILPTPHHMNCATGCSQLGVILRRINLVEHRKLHLMRLSQSWLWLQNLKYPLVMIILLFFTGVAVLMVVTNAVELLVGFRTLPLGTEKVELGTTSLSSLGICGTVFEAITIFYLMAASLVGFYSVPWLKKLKPAVKQTSMTKIICNCVILIILTSALPVLARTLGITTFDLLGDYGKLDWLGNFYLVLLYNVVFALATGLCLVTKFTSKIRMELLNRFNEAGAQLRSRQYWTTSSSTIRSISVDSRLDSNDNYHLKHD